MSVLTAEQISTAQAISIGDVAGERGFKLKKGAYAGPCPHCGGTDRFSISVRKGVFLCRQCQPKGGGGAIGLVMFLDGVGFREAVETLTGKADKPVHRAKPRPAHKPAQHDRAAQVSRLWRESVDPRGSLAEVYLNGRGLDLDDDLAMRVFRFHGRCPFGERFVPALLAAFRPFRNDDESKPPHAIHRIGLNADGSKIGKLMLGSVGGCAVKLDSDEDVEQGLGICEGIETGLAIRATGWRPVWALGSAGAIAKFEPLPGIEALTIFADNDASGTGMAAAKQCAGAWLAAGREVFIRIPRSVGADWLDVS